MTERSARALLRRFGHFADRFAGCFSRQPQRAVASQYLEGLFNDSERKSMQAMHGRLSDPVSYQALQHFITDSPWETPPVWAQLRAVVPVRRGILALDDTSFPKQGHHSVGVKRQYCGALGKIANCQVAVSTVLFGAQLTWPLSFELYLPHDWFTDPTRRAHARIPEGVRFREKWRIALAHIRQVLKAGFQLTAVVADADYGSKRRFGGVERLGLRYGLAIRSVLTMWTPTPHPDGGGSPPPCPSTWAKGTKGPLAARFAAVRVRPAMAEAPLNQLRATRLHVLSQEALIARGASADQLLASSP